jgi:hypothetical protein
VLGAFLGTVFSFQRRRAHRLLGIANGKTGSVSFLQRSGGAISLNLHYRVLVIDGVYADPEGTMKGEVPRETARSTPSCGPASAALK